MVVPIRLANSTWRGVLTGASVLACIVLIKSPISSEPQAEEYVQSALCLSDRKEIGLSAEYRALR